MDNYDSDVTYLPNAFVFFVMCPVLIFIWDLFHYTHRNQSVEQESGNEDNYNSVEEIASDATVTVSENSDDDLILEEQEESSRDGACSRRLSLYRPQGESRNDSTYITNPEAASSAPPIDPIIFELSTLDTSPVNDSASFEQPKTPSSTGRERTNVEQGRILGTLPVSDPSSFGRSEGNSSLGTSVTHPTSFGPSEVASSLGVSIRSVSFEQAEAASRPTPSENFSSSQGRSVSFEQSAHGSSSREEPVSSERAGGSSAQGFSPRDVLDSSRIEESNGSSSNNESDNMATSISPITTVNRRESGRHRKPKGDQKTCSRRAATGINSVLQDQLNKMEDSCRYWLMFKNKENLTEDTCQKIRDVLQQYKKFKSSESVKSLNYYLKGCIEDKDNFSQSVTSEYLYSAWWKVHGKLNRLGNNFKSLDPLKGKTGSDKKKRGEISADSSLLRETQSWTEKKRVRSPTSDEDQAKSRIPRSMNQQASTSGASASSSQSNRRSSYVETKTKK